MRHVYPKDGADLIGNLAHALVVPLTGIGRSSSDDQLGTDFLRSLFHRIVVDHAGFRVKTVGIALIEDSGSVHGRTMCKVTSLAEIQAHEGITRLKAGHGDRHVGLGAGMGLDIGIFGIIELAEPVDCDLLDLVHHLASTVVSLSGIPFGIFVCTDGPHRLHHLVADIILRCDQFETGGLPVAFLVDKIKDL